MDTVKLSSWWFLELSAREALEIQVSKGRDGIRLMVRAAWEQAGSSRSLLGHKEILRAWICHRHDTKVKEARDIV